MFNFTITRNEIITSYAKNWMKSFMHAFILMTFWTNYQARAFEIIFLRNERYHNRKWKTKSSKINKMLLSQFNGKTVLGKKPFVTISFHIKLVETKMIYLKALFITWSIISKAIFIVKFRCWVLFWWNLLYFLVSFVWVGVFSYFFLIFTSSVTTLLLLIIDFLLHFSRSLNMARTLTLFIVLIAYGMCRIQFREILFYLKCSN